MKEVIIDSLSNGLRLDKFLKKYLENAPLDVIFKLLRKKDVKVNDVREKKDYILKTGDIVKIYLLDSQIEEFTKQDSIIKTSYKLDIIYEDNNILIVNKPSSLLVHGDEKEKRRTLANYVINYLMEKGEYSLSSTFVPSPAHRLDRNTSGIVIFAKNYESLTLLEELFKDKKEINKTYLGLVVGNVSKDGKISLPLYKDEKKKLVTVDRVKGKEALTLYKVKKIYQDYTLLEIQIITGRTHQIRVHFKAINHPLIGDNKYGDFKFNKLFKEQYNYESQFLHAYKIEFKNIDGILSYLSNKTFVANIGKKEEEILRRLQ